MNYRYPIISAKEYYFWPEYYYYPYPYDPWWGGAILMGVGIRLPLLGLPPTLFFSRKRNLV